MKYSEVCDANFFVMPSYRPFSKLVYFVDYTTGNGVSHASKLIARKKLHVKVKESMILDSRFFLTGVIVKDREWSKFEEVMKLLENQAPLFVQNYREKRIQILDQIVVLQ